MTQGNHLPMISSISFLVLQEHPLSMVQYQSFYTMTMTLWEGVHNPA